MTSLIALCLFLVFLGVIGAYGITKGNAGINALKAYIIILIVVFVIQNVLLNYAGFKSSEVETSFKNKLGLMVENSAKVMMGEQSEFDKSCIAMKSVSLIFQCCDKQGECCMPKTNGNCAEKMIETIKTRFEIVILVSLFLFCEFLIILIGTFMLGNAIKSRSYKLREILGLDNQELELIS